MKASLKDMLDRKMQEWIDDCVKHVDWPGILVHDDFAEDLADTVADVVDTIEINQSFLRREGFMGG